MAIPDPSINTQTQGGDSAFENVFVFGQLNYDFDRDNLKIRSIDVSSESSFTKDVTFSGNINVSGSGTFIGDLGVDELTARNANITGIVTTSGDLYVSGRFRDENSNSGSAGQILASTGNGVDWIDANTTSVNNSINVGVNVDSTDADQFVSFFGANSGNNPNRVDAAFTYNPSTNTMSGINYSGTSTFNNANITGVTTVGTAISFASGAKIYDGDGNLLLNKDGEPILKRTYSVDTGTLLTIDTKTKKLYSGDKELMDISSAFTPQKMEFWTPIKTL